MFIIFALVYKLPGQNSISQIRYSAIFSLHGILCRNAKRFCFSIPSSQTPRSLNYVHELTFYSSRPADPRIRIHLEHQWMCSPIYVSSIFPILISIECFRFNFPVNRQHITEPEPEPARFGSGHHTTNSHNQSTPWEPCSLGLARLETATYGCRDLAPIKKGGRSGEQCTLPHCHEMW